MNGTPDDHGWLHKVFGASLFAKGAMATVETLSGLIFLLAPAGRVKAWAMALVELDVIESRSGPLASRAERLVQQFAGPQQHFYAVYLLSHGVAKLALVGLLAARIRGAFPLGIAMQFAFIAYQMERWARSGSLFMLGASILDAVIIWLIWREWQEQKAAPGRI